MQNRWVSALVGAVCISSSLLAGTQSPAKAEPPAVISYDENSITFDHGVAANGNSHIKFYPDGRVEFQSHFHDSGAADYWYSITWAVRASDGTVFTLHHRAKIIGHVFGRGQSDRNSNFDETVTNAEVAQHWAALTRANTARMSAHTAATFGGLVDTAEEAINDVKQAVSAAEGVYETVSSVVAIFA
jgi:hypothetical protein